MGLSSISRHRGAGAIGAAERLALGSEIRRLRIARGMTQRELADPLTRAYVCAVERGRATPSLASLMLFADRLGVPVRSLIDVLELAATRTTGGFTRS